VTVDCFVYSGEGNADFGFASGGLVNSDVVTLGKAYLDLCLGYRGEAILGEVMTGFRLQ
jgi:hypothetical protein